MKNFLLRTLFFLLVFSFWGCQDQVEDQITKDSSIEKRHDTWDPTPSYDPCDADNIWVCVDPCFQGTPWECAITNAINAYNSLPSPYSSSSYYNIPNGININMNLLWDCDDLPPGETANIQIDCADLNGATGRTFPPDADDLRLIELDNGVPTDWPCDDDPIASCCQLQRTVMHELGHALGFGHSEPGNTGAIPETYIPGTDPDDENSVFIQGGNRDFCEHNCLFSKGDLLALSILYPSIHPQDAILEGPGDLCVGEVGTFCVTGLPDGYSTTITANGNTVSVSNGHCLDLSFASAGTYQVLAQSCLDDCCVEDCCLDFYVYVTVLPDVGECYCVCEAEDQSGDDGIYLEYIEIDCCDERDCSEIVPDWWDEYLVNRNDCYKVTQ